MAAADIQKLFAGQDAPSPAGETVVLGTPFTVPSRAIYVSGAGSLTLTMLDGNDLTFPAVQAGAILPVKALKAVAGSTATGLVALF